MECDRARPSEYLVDGNRLTMITPGAERLAMLLQLIEGAGIRLDLYFYIFDTDAVATRIRDALMAACRRGVAVTLLIDAFGSATAPSAFFEPLQAAGARFARFGTRPTTRYLIRNHQKMAIADGTRAMAGGFNIARDYFARDEDPDGWRDVALLVEGPLASDLLRWFDSMAAWTLSDRQSFRALRKMVRDWQPGHGRAAWLMGGPTRHLNGWARHVKRDLQVGQRLDMAAAYFSPGWAMVARLARLSRAGSARIVTPSRSDNKATIGAARHVYRRLLRAGSTLFEFLPQKLHAKLLAIDGIAYVGSANFDMRSLYLNVELMLRVEDWAFAEAVRAEIGALATSSQPITQTAYQAMAGPFNRLRWWFDHLLVGVLDYTVTRRLLRRAKGDD